MHKAVSNSAIKAVANGEVFTHLMPTCRAPPPGTAFMKAMLNPDTKPMHPPRIKTETKRIQKKKN